jgi:hypothetical protein
MSIAGIPIVGDRFWAKDGAWLFSFGAYGDTRVIAFGHLETALEDAAGWLAENAPGMFSPPDYEMAAEDLELDWSIVRAADCDDPDLQRVIEAAETDHTYTEAGWLLSWEWTADEITDPVEIAAVAIRMWDAEYAEGEG